MALFLTCLHKSKSFPQIISIYNLMYVNVFVTVSSRIHLQSKVLVLYLAIMLLLYIFWHFICTVHLVWKRISFTSLAIASSIIDETIAVVHMNSSAKVCGILNWAALEATVTRLSLWSSEVQHATGFSVRPWLISRCQLGKSLTVQSSSPVHFLVAASWPRSPPKWPGETSCKQLLVHQSTQPSSVLLCKQENSNDPIVKTPRSEDFIASINYINHQHWLGYRHKTWQMSHVMQFVSVFLCI